MKPFAAFGLLAAAAIGLCGAAPPPAGAEEPGNGGARIAVFVDLGAQTTRMSSKIANTPGNVERTDSGLHLGAGVRRGIGGGRARIGSGRAGGSGRADGGSRGDLGVRVELDDLGGDLFLGVRALDYRRNVSERFAWTGFFGVGRLELATPAYGWYAGGGLQIKNVLERWDLNLDVRYGDRLARDNILPTDPQGGSPDNFHSLYGVSVYLSRRF